MQTRHNRNFTMVAKYTTIISKTKRLLKRFALNLIYNILREPARGYLLLRTKSDFDLTTAKFYQPNVLQGCTSISGCIRIAARTTLCLTKIMRRG